MISEDKEVEMISDIAVMKSELIHLNEDLREHMDGEEEKVRKVHHALLLLGFIQVLQFSGFTGPEVWAFVASLL